MCSFAKTAVALVALFLCAPAFSQAKGVPASRKAAPKSEHSSATGTKYERAATRHMGIPTNGAAVTLTDRQRALHVLNRLAFGPRPGDVQAVLAKGIDAWIEDQLHPESIDDSALNARLAPYTTTRMTPKQLAEWFPTDGLLRQAIAGKRAIPDDPVVKLIYAVNIARIKQLDAAKSAAQSAESEDASTKQDTAAALASRQADAQAIAELLLATPKEQRLTALENSPPEKLVNFINLLRPDQRDRLNAEATPQEREVFRALVNPPAVVAGELQQAKVIRAIYSQRQLQEVMTDFWMNHFNVYQYKDADVFYTTAYERDVIRPHALGKFYDLLVAVAQSPAMLEYLDNWMSIGPHSQAAGKNGQSGLNENYGRELMELHTLGVDGGYTQADVVQMATILSGWTIAQPLDGGQFLFDPRRHEPGDKVLLGQKFYFAGQEEGMRALDMLAHSPATAHFISKCLATRFVSDDPPESLVEHLTSVFQSSDGDIREVLRALFQSPEFWSPKAYKAKFKTPLEFVASAVRASGANVVATDALVVTLANMGMQPYGMAVPTGYSMLGSTWKNEGALLARINFATNLTEDKIGGVQFDPAALVVQGILTDNDAARTKAAIATKHSGADVALALCEDAILQGDFSAEDEAAIRKQIEAPDVERRMATSPLDVLRLISGFILGSPDFQYR